MIGMIMLLLVSNAYQFKRNMVLSDNDLKYRFIRMHGRASGADLDTLEVIFTHNKDKNLLVTFATWWKILNTVQG